jgi:hypothetical protein
MEDFIDATFAELDAFYPNSKRKRRAVAEPKVKEIKPWDSRKFVKTLPNGKDADFYTIGSLSVALNRPIITLRTWIKQGHIPTSPYRLPAKSDKNGDQRLGRRLYTHRMIEVVVEIFAQHGILDTDRVEWSKHRNLGNEISEAWGKIRAEELNINNNEKE